ncbi:conserved eukaryotic nuclear protein [Cryptosporidium ryanae]|uniref:conserved eukaryotic nuclear protein n=1 Tax=Cryptosporidium ryanae TaxID=515981 RepID=UPI00351A97FC|nr:conserved eukaryotic nuclear protein [Cryptosporidium ryanae]
MKGRSKGRKDGRTWVSMSDDKDDVEFGKGEVEVMGIEDDGFSDENYENSESGSETGHGSESYSESEYCSEVESKTESRSSNWGKKKKDFYDGGSSGSESEENWSDIEMQDKEAQEIQESIKKRLDDSDFGVGDIMDEIDADKKRDDYNEIDFDMNKDESFGDSFNLSMEDANELLEGFNYLCKKTSGEDLTKSKTLSDRSVELKEDELVNLKLELGTVIESMKDKVKEVKERVQVLLDFVKTGEGNSLVTEKGLDYLDSKNTLLIMYIGYLCYYLMLKVSPGVDIKNHPILIRLVTLRTMMEKLKSLDVKLQPQIDRMVKLAEKSLKVDKFLESAPRLDRFALDEDEIDDYDNGINYESNKDSGIDLDDEARESKAKTSSCYNDEYYVHDESTNYESNSSENGMNIDNNEYVAPKNIPTEFSDKKISKAEKMMKELERERQRLLKTDIIRQMRSSVSDAPEMVGIDEDINENLPQLERLQRKIREKIEFEEGNMTRLQRTKKDKRDEKLYKRLLGKIESGVNSLEDLAQFAEKAVDLATDSKKNSLSRYLNNASKLNKEITKSKEIQQGSDKSITEKLAKRMKNKAELNIRNKYKHEDFGDLNESVDFEHQDEFNSDEDYQNDQYLNDVMKFKQERKLEKISRRNEFNSKNMPNIDDLVNSGSRRASTKEMIKNKGLTRKRKKIEGNARVHNRLKYKKAIKKLKGMQRGVREYENNYSGESNGLKDNIKRSTSFI